MTTGIVIILFWDWVALFFLLTNEVMALERSTKFWKEQISIWQATHKSNYLLMSGSNLILAQLYKAVVSPNQSPESSPCRVFLKWIKNTPPS